MTLADVLTAVARADIRLEAEGDRLVVDAPVGALTPDLRAELTAHKSALLALCRRPQLADLRADLTAHKSALLAGRRPQLAPVTEFVSLRGGLVLPLPAVLLGLDLERRGYMLRLDGDHQIVVERVEDTAELTELTADDVAAIARWRWHLGALVAYQPPEM